MRKSTLDLVTTEVQTLSVVLPLRTNVTKILEFIKKV